MIYTVTPNPALDTCGVVGRLIPDEKNYVQGVTHFPGGNGVNVARILTRLNTPCTASGFLGGSIGGEFREVLNREGVLSDFVTIEGTTRMSVTVTQSKTHCQTRLSFTGPSIMRSEAEALEKRIEKLGSRTILMCGGSLPESYSVRRVFELAALAKKKRLPVVVDCPGKLLRPLLNSRPTLIKPNLIEFQELVEKKLHSIDAVVSAARELNQKVRLVCVSSVEGGALLITRKGIWYGKGKRIKACSAVGAGDSMVAGMLFQLFNELQNEAEWEALAPDLLRWGIAAGMATACRPTGSLGQAPDIRNFTMHVKIKRIG